MPAFYRYSMAILGSQTTTDGGAAVDYRYAPTGTWRWTGSDTFFLVEEANAADTDIDGDPSNENISADIQIGGVNEQTVDVGGIDRQLIWDYTFEVTDGSGTFWRVGVIDVDLNNSDVIEAGSENGYFLVFPDGFPPADTNLTYTGIVENDPETDHIDLSAEVVCFASGTMIDTAGGARAIETLSAGDLVMTRDRGLQPIRWIGKTHVIAKGDLAPVVISKGVLNNAVDLVVSPQHAMLVEDWRAELLYGAPDVLVRAVDLLNHDGVYRRTGGTVTYCHILLDTHELVRASGQWSETLYPGEMTRQVINPCARAEIETLFPDLKGYGPKAARCLRHFEAACLSP